MPGKGIKCRINNYFGVISKQGSFLDFLCSKFFLISDWKFTDIDLLVLN